MNLSRPQLAFSLITATAVVVLDLATKDFWFHQPIPGTVLGPFLTTVQHRNYGLIFNIPAPTWLIVGVSGMVLTGVIYLFGRRLTETPIALALGLLVGGAVGNGYDRSLLGFVRDWILAFHRSAFNVADIAIALGLILLFFSHEKKVDGSV